jgi:hypothetical protein
MERLKNAFFGGGSGENRVNAVLGEVGPIGGLAGILAGPGAKTANKRALALAKALKERGHPDEEIWQQTGKQFDQPWWLGHSDEVPRFEIDDSMAAFGVPGPGTYTQREAMWHPELQEAYPDLAKSKLEVIPDFPHSGQYSSKEDVVRMGADQAKDPTWGRSVNLHELQHAIQRREGMTAGGAPAQFYDPEKAEAAHQLYRRLGGEMDARAVQHRKDLTQGERLAKPFWESYDVPMKEMVLAEQLRKPK